MLKEQGANMTNSKTSNKHFTKETFAADVDAQVKLGYSEANAIAYVKRMRRYLANPNAL